MRVRLPLKNAFPVTGQRIGHGFSPFSGADEHIDNSARLRLRGCVHPNLRRGAAQGQAQKYGQRQQNPQSFPHGFIFRSSLSQPCDYTLRTEG